MKAKHDIIMGGFLSEFNRTFYARCFSKITVITNLIAQNLVKTPPFHVTTERTPYL